MPQWRRKHTCSRQQVFTSWSSMNIWMLSAIQWQAIQSHPITKGDHTNHPYFCCLQQHRPCSLRCHFSKRQSESGESAKDRAEEAWIENIRVVEALRKLIQDKLERREYVEEEDVSMSGTEGTEVKAEEKSSESLYPVLRADDE